MVRSKKRRQRHNNDSSSSSSDDEEQQQQDNSTQAITTKNQHDRHETGDILRSAYTMKKAGNIMDLQHQHVKLAAPEEFECTVAIRAIGLNFADIFTLLGLYSATPVGEFIPCLEYSGVITAIGPKVNNKNFPNIKVGERVVGITRFGAATTRLNIHAQYLRILPADWSFAEGASLIAQALTAYYGLKELARMKKGETVLIHSGAGGTGLFGILICQLLGANPVVTVGSSSKVSLLTGENTNENDNNTCLLDTPLPASAVIDRSSVSSSSSEIKKTLLDAAKTSYNAKGLDIVFDTLMGDWFHPCLDSLLPMGRHVVLGAGSMTPSSSSVNWIKLGYQYLTRPTIDPLNLISLNKSIHCFNLIWLYEKYDTMGPLLDEMLEVINFGKKSSSSKKEKTTTTVIKPIVGHIFPFEKMIEAVTTLQSGKTHGKVVVEVGEEACYDL